MEKKFIFIVVCTRLPQACKEEEFSSQFEKVQFTFTDASPDAPSGRVISQLPPGTSLLIIISDNWGNSVVTCQGISLLSVGDNYITEPLEPGHYDIADFMLVDESEVLYAAPKRSASPAAAVTFTAISIRGRTKNSVTNIEMEVVNATEGMFRLENLYSPQPSTESLEKLEALMDNCQCTVVYTQHE